MPIGCACGLHCEGEGDRRALGTPCSYAGQSLCEGQSPRHAVQEVVLFSAKLQREAQPVYPNAAQSNGW